KLRAFPKSNHSNVTGNDRYVLVGDAPVWMLQEGWYTVTTGPRSDPLRADGIRFARLDASDKIDTLLVVEGVPRRDLRMKFEVDLDPPADFWNAREERFATKPARAELDILLGARDVDSDQRPMRATLLALREDAVELVDLAETGRDANAWMG